ncbi:MAG: LysR substrate-binding domain-containing protein [Moorellales bacterium]
MLQRRTLDAYLASLGLEPRLAAEVSHPEDARKAVKSRAAATIMPAVVVEEDLALGTLVRLEPPAPLPRQEYKLVRPRARLRAPAREFCRFLLKDEFPGRLRRAPVAAEGGFSAR